MRFLFDLYEVSKYKKQNNFATIKREEKKIDTSKKTSVKLSKK